jgi:hypothetical protein
MTHETTRCELVTWIDARSQDGWTDQADLDVRVAIIETLGHVIKETEEVLCIASSMDMWTDQVAGIMFIPIRCVLKRLKQADVVEAKEGE